MINRTPLYDGLVNYMNEKNVSFHMPGHKNGRGILKIKEKPDFKDNLIFIDQTEVPGLDNLHAPEGIIKEAQEYAARAFRSDYTYFLVNGTTCGVYSMILGVTNDKDKIIVPRNSHRSVAGALIIGGLWPVYYQPDVDLEKGIAVSVSCKAIEKAIKENPDAKAVLVTNPTFYGTCSDIEAIAELVHKNNMVLLVDEAHGAHLPFNRKLPICAMDAGADVAVESIHKTLSSFTQSSMLHIRKGRVDVEKIEFMLRLTQTTSPSYLLMASLDLARYQMEEHGSELLDNLLDMVQSFRERVNSIPDIYCFGKEIIGQYNITDVDLTKVTINFKNFGIAGTRIARILRNEYKIQVELSDLYNILAIGTIADEREDYDRLYNAILDISKKHSSERKVKSIPQLEWKMPYQALSPREAVYEPMEMIDFKHSEGRISADIIAPYPPGIPVILPGEIITSDIIENLLTVKEAGIKINGPRDQKLEKVAVIK
ncbi:MAG: aminotransferase class I/II-fold pyridoxal phosphate-dependent enzyme [Clostridiales bacterium]|nr:aminotransferase class I/II-fold pyridoxal phosphate-dependent enzyme [Clostridiales bacterium]HBM79410.1 arginine decarboxylase [Clostridiaceae bacterium]